MTAAKATHAGTARPIPRLHRNRPVLTQHTCLAHLADLLDRAERSRRAARIIWKVDYPDPIITELTITVDTRAAAHGRRRFIRTERIVTGAIALALVADQAGFPAAPTPRPHRAEGARRPGPTIRGESQETLF